MILGLFRRRTPDAHDAADALYATIVAAARRPEFYRDLGAPDTLPGRFELVVLHVALCVRRLRRDPDPEAQVLSQGLFDAMFRALDANLRELGVGDVVVPKRIKTMARSFYDGARLYDAALDAGDRRALVEALARTVYSAPGSGAPGPSALADYAVRADAGLAAQTVADLKATGPSFPGVREDA